LSEYADKSSKIEFEIKTNGACYAYGADFNKNEVLEEWLTKINKRSEQNIYTRKNLKDSVKVEFDKVKFDNKDNEDFARFTGRGTPRNRLFLLEANRRNLNFIEEINDVFDWFSNKLRVIFPDSRNHGLEFNLREDNDLTDAFTSFLKYFNTGISELSVKEIKPEIYLKELPEDLIKDIKQSLKPGNRGIVNLKGNRRNYSFEKTKSGEIHAHRLTARHTKKDGKNVYFELNEESDGTNRLIDLIPSLLDLGINDSVYFIDELDRSMHPILTREIIDFFLDKTRNTASQLIATTHESNLLDLELLRRDEIWFVEKDQNNSSSLYSLLEFKPRKETKIKNGYLNGRYGAIPFLSNPEELNW
jgi:AAA15 family ATPase/GTPase